MVILELVRAVGVLADGASTQVPINSGADLELARRWADRTGNTIIGSTVDDAGLGTVKVRRGRPPDPALTLGTDRLPGARLWFYTNFHCNLACDYCCVASGPTVPHRELGAERIARLVAQGVQWGVREIYLTGGEPMLLADIDEIVRICADQLPTTLLTNGMLFQGRRLRALQAMPREGFALQISLDSATPTAHDAHRGAGSWTKAVDGIRIALDLGFRVRVAATIASPDPALFTDLHGFLDDLGIARPDQVVRPVAHQGVAEEGVQLTRDTLVPEVTVTSDGVYWHPVSATDEHALVTTQLEPLGPTLDHISELFTAQWAATSSATALFPCA